MNIFDALTDTEKSMMCKYINSYANGCHTVYPSDLPNILRHWVSNKQRIFEMFGEKLILKKEIDIEKDANQLSNALSQEIHTRKPGEDFYTRFWNAISKIENAIHDAPGNDWGDVFIFRTLYNTYTLAKNEYQEGNKELRLSDSKTLKIQNGCKPMRMLQKIFNFYGESEIFEELRLRHSMVLNEKCFKGTLCLSIHPLDYMTMSDNNCNWNSCMNWVDQGSYRRGTVEMMNSPMAIVAYLESDKDYMINGEPWNSKKWRELILYNRDFICGVKGYPYWNKNLEETAVNWVKELVPNSADYGPTETIYPYSNEYNYLGIYPVYFEPEADAMYNDFNDEVGHKGCFSKNYLDERGDYHYYFNYSGASTCMCCGDYVEFDSDNEWKLVCDDCDDSNVCEWCDESFSGEGYEVDGYYLCSYCYEEHTFYDDITGEMHLENNGENIKLISLNQSPDGAVIDKSYTITTYCEDLSDLANGYRPEWYESKFKEMFGNANLYKISIDNGYYWGPRHYYAVNVDEIEDFSKVSNVLFLADDELEPDGWMNSGKYGNILNVSEVKVVYGPDKK